MRAYFDDSNSHEEATFFIVGGCYGPDEIWEPLEDAWRALLRKWGLTYFKMSDAYASSARNPSGQFSSWDPDEVKLCVQEFSDLVLDYPLRGLSRALRQTEIRPYYLSLKGRGVAKEIHNPYLYIALHLIHDIREIYNSQDPGVAGRSLEIVFDNQEREGEVHAALVGMGVVPAQLRHVSHTFTSSVAVPALQVADMLAWTHGRDMNVSRTGAKTWLYERLKAVVDMKELRTDDLFRPMLNARAFER